MELLNLQLHDILIWVFDDLADDLLSVVHLLYHGLMFLLFLFVVTLA